MNILQTPFWTLKLSLGKTNAVHGEKILKNAQKCTSLIENKLDTKKKMNAFKGYNFYKMMFGHLIIMDPRPGLLGLRTYQDRTRESSGGSNEANFCSLFIHTLPTKLIWNVQTHFNMKIKTITFSVIRKCVYFMEEIDSSRKKYFLNRVQKLNGVFVMMLIRLDSPFRLDSKNFESGLRSFSETFYFLWIKTNKKQCQSLLSTSFAGT